MLKAGALAMQVRRTDRQLGPLRGARGGRSAGQRAGAVRRHRARVHRGHHAGAHRARAGQLALLQRRAAQAVRLVAFACFVKCKGVEASLSPAKLFVPSLCVMAEVKLYQNALKSVAVMYTWD